MNGSNGSCEFNPNNVFPDIAKDEFVGRYAELVNQYTTIENEAQVTDPIAWEIKRVMKGEFGLDSPMYNACLKRWISQ